MRAGQERKIKQDEIPGGPGGSKGIQQSSTLFETKKKFNSPYYDEFDERREAAGKAEGMNQVFFLFFFLKISLLQGVKGKKLAEYIMSVYICEKRRKESRRPHALYDCLIRRERNHKKETKKKTITTFPQVKLFPPCSIRTSTRRATGPSCWDELGCGAWP